MKTEQAISGERVLPAEEEKRVPGWVMPVAQVSAIAVDAALAAACFIAAFVIREGAPILADSAWAWSREFVPYAGILYFAVVVRVAMLAYQRAYRFYGAFSYTHEFLKVFKAVSVGSMLIVAWAFLFRGGYAFRDFPYSRGVFVLDFSIAAIAYTCFHLGLRTLQSAVRRRDINLVNTLIVGTNSEATQTIAELKHQPELGYRVVGIISTHQAEGDAANAATFDSVAIIGGLDDLPALIRRYGIREVIITDTEIESSRLFDVMMGVGRRRRVEFRFAPSLFNLIPQKTSVEQLGVLPMVRLFREPLSEAERFVKRAFDIFIAASVLTISAPLMGVAALAVRLGSRGPVIFSQERVGMDGRVFLCYKFRTMYADADDSPHRDAYRQNIEGRNEANGGDGERPVFGKVKNDQRITRAGRWLRRFSLDELPQLFNVLKGDMSIVGPRPPIPYEVEDYQLRHRKRLDMKPGITGLWQVSGRSRLSFEEMVRIDLYYIENWSLWLDLRIILLTLPAVFRGEGEE